MENVKEIKINQESVSKALNLSRAIETIKVIGNKSPEANEKARNLLGSSFSTKYESVEEMINTTKDENKTEIQRKNAVQALNLLGSAICLTEKGKANDLVLEGKLSENLPTNLVGIEKYVAENLLMSGKDDKVGQEIVTNLIGLEKLNKRAEIAPAAFAEKQREETKRIIETLFDRFDEVDPNSVEAGKISAVVGCLDNTLSKTEKEKNKGEDEDEDKYRGRSENIDFKNKDEILHKCRELLNYLENISTYSGDISISNKTTNILENIVNVKLAGKEGFEDIQEEVNARLSLHDTAYFMKMANGSLSDRSNESIPRAISEIEKNGGFLTREKMKFFFEDKANLGFSRAWDLLQEANFSYKEILLKAGVAPEKVEQKFSIPLVKDAYFGNKYINYEYDSKEEDKKAVEKYMLNQLGGGEKALKALQLAQKMFIASDETSVLNNGFQGGDDFAEAIQFSRFREDDARPGKAKNAGPDIHRGWIKSLTPGWLRNFSGIEDPDAPIKSETIRRNWDNLEGKKDWSTYHSVIVCKKVGPLKELLLDKTLKKPEEVVDINFFKSKIDLFNKLDDKGKKGWRAWWVAGLLQTSMINYNNVWDKDHIVDLKRILTEESLTLTDQPNEYFLTSKQWSWIEKNLNLKKYFMIDTIADIIGDMYKIKRKR